MWQDFSAMVQSIDVTALDRDELGDLAGSIGSLRAVLDGLEGRIAVAMRELGASEATTAETLRHRTGCSAREARHRARRAETLQQMPNVAEALSAGRITGEHATALARAAAETSPEAVDGDAGLLAAAQAVPADLASHKAKDWARRHQTEDDQNRLHQWQRRNRSLNFTEGHGDMLTGIAKFDRVSGAQFQALVDALADRLYRADGGRDNPGARTRSQCRFDALLALVGIEPTPLATDGHLPGDGETAGDAGDLHPDRLRPPRIERLPALVGGRAEAGAGNSRTGGPESDRLRRGRPPGAAVWPGCTCGRGLGVRGQLSIVLDVPYIASNGEQGRCEIPGIGEIARSELERRACDADIYGLIFSSDGLPLHHGRKTRTVSPQQWRALVARDRGCVICGIRPDWCQAHHVEAWLRGGCTDLDNLALVCHGHHRWIHDNDITLQLTPNGWRAPPGVPMPRPAA